MQRINGELTAFNLVCILARYRPSVFVIENPRSSRLWEYIEDVLGINIPYENNTYYAHYDYPLAKPTRFKSNINLGLISNYTRGSMLMKDFSKDYNVRSQIPLKLIHHIYDKVQEYLEQKWEN